MTGADEALRDLAKAYGVHLGFHDLQGHEHAAAPETLRALLGGMGVEADTPAAVTEALDHLRARQKETHVPPEILARAGAPLSLPVSAPCDWMLLDETGAEVQTGRAGESIDLGPDRKSVV